jgi:hypothetical protein
VTTRCRLRYERRPAAPQRPQQQVGGLLGKNTSRDRWRCYCRGFCYCWLILRNDSIKRGPFHDGSCAWGRRTAGGHGPSTPPPQSGLACGRPRTVCCIRQRRRPGRSRHSRAVWHLLPTGLSCVRRRSHGCSPSQMNFRPPVGEDNQSARRFMEHSRKQSITQIEGARGRSRRPLSNRRAFRASVQFYRS